MTQDSNRFDPSKLSLFMVKIGRVYRPVLAESMSQLDNWVTSKGLEKWHTVGIETQSKYKQLRTDAIIV